MRKKHITDRTILLFEYTNYLNEDDQNPSPTPPQGEEMNVGDDVNQEGEDLENEFNFEEDDSPAQSDLGDQMDDNSSLADDGTEEIDVTQLVEKQNELVAQFSELQNSLSSITQSTDQITQQISKELSSIKSYFNDEFKNKFDEIKKELIVRNPTPKEDLTLRSLDSYPYNIKVSEYFTDYADQKKKDRENLVLNLNNKQTQQEEDNQKRDFVLTKDALTKISDLDVKNSF